jgi:hypothetical protein
MERVGRIELPSEVWKTPALPLCYTRINKIKLTFKSLHPFGICSQLQDPITIAGLISNSTYTYLTKYNLICQELNWDNLNYP